MPLVILHHLLNVSVQLANKRGLKKTSSHDTTKKRGGGIAILPKKQHHKTLE
jgi:hypothetical protein